MIKDSLTCATHWPVLGMVLKAMSHLQGKLGLSTKVERTGWQVQMTVRSLAGERTPNSHPSVPGRVREGVRLGKGRCQVLTPGESLQYPSPEGPQRHTGIQTDQARE